MELDKLKRMKNINTTKYREWSSDEVVDWLISLEDGKFLKYEDMFRVIFNQQGVDGSTIGYIDKSELKGWGIDSFSDRARIHENIQNLINKNKQSPSLSDKND